MSDYVYSHKGGWGIKLDDHCLNFKSFPDELIRLTNKEALRSCFIQTLKEADQLKHKANVVKSMTAEEHLKLFDSIIDGRFI